MYADDASVSYCSIKEAMNKDLTTIVEWLQGNKLSLYKAMVISTKQKEKRLTRNNKELPMKIQEEPIDNVLITKCLGIQMDRNLDWKSHMKALLSKISKALGLLKHAKRC